MLSPDDQWKLIEEAAASMGVDAEARRKWRERGRVAYRWRLPILNYVKANKKRLDPAIFDQIPQDAA